MRVVAIHDRPASDLCGIHAFVTEEDGVNRVRGFRDRERTLTDEEVRAYVERGDFLAVDVELEVAPTFEDLVLLWVGHDVNEECQRHSLPRVLSGGGVQTDGGAVLATERKGAERRLAAWMKRAVDSFLEPVSNDDKTALAQLMLRVDHRSWLALAASLETTPAGKRAAYLDFLLRGDELRGRAGNAATLEELLRKTLTDRPRLQALQQRPAPFFPDQPNRVAA